MNDTHSPSDELLTAIRGRIDRVAAKLNRIEPVRPLDVHAAVEAGRDALAVIEQLRAELSRLRACDCFPNPHDHADRCPIYQAGALAVGKS
jgi:hypothetical protein